MIEWDAFSSHPHIFCSKSIRVCGNRKEEAISSFGQMGKSAEVSWNGQILFSNAKLRTLSSLSKGDFEIQKPKRIKKIVLIIIFWNPRERICPFDNFNISVLYLGLDCIFFLDYNILRKPCCVSFQIAHLNRGST